MIYQCKDCKKAYSDKELIKMGSYKITKEGLKPICPNCRSRNFNVTDMVKIK